MTGVVFREVASEVEYGRVGVASVCLFTERQDICGWQLRRIKSGKIGGDDVITFAAAGDGSVDEACA